VLRYLLEFHGLTPSQAALEHAIAFGDPETIRMVWDRMDAEARVKYRGPLESSIVFHHAEVAKWLVAEHPPWLGLARRMARERRAFDILLRLPEGNEELPELVGLVKKHAKALEHLGIPLGFLIARFKSTFRPEAFDEHLYRVCPSLLVVEGDSGLTFGAYVAIRWPKLGSTAKDVWCRSFLFTVDGEEATRYPTATPPALFHDREKIRIGELTLDMTKREYSVNAPSSCTGGRFPALSGKAADWGMWRV
jgi:hypothetical protein